VLTLYSEAVKVILKREYMITVNYTSYIKSTYSAPTFKCMLFIYTVYWLYTQQQALNVVLLYE